MGLDVLYSGIVDTANRGVLKIHAEEQSDSDGEDLALFVVGVRLLATAN